MPENLNRWEMEVFIHRQHGRFIGWLANVINTTQPEPERKLRALHALAVEDRVGAGVLIDQISIDGSIVSMCELNQYSQ